MPVKLSPDQGRMMVNQWRDQISALIEQVALWAKKEGWQVERSKTDIQEDGLPDYSTQTLEIMIRDERRVYLEPIARLTLNGRGVVELYGWPSMRRVRLQPQAGVDNSSAWIVMTDSGIPLRGGWTRENFVQLANDLVAQ